MRFRGRVLKKGLQSIHSPGVRKGVGILVSVVCLFLVFWKVSWKDLFASFLKANPFLLFLAGLSYAASILFRSASWRKILSTNKVIPLQDVFAYECIGYLANNIMPMRLGELTRAVLVAEREALAKTIVLSSIALERLFDILLLFLASLAVLSLVALPSGVVHSIFAVGGLAIGTLLTLWLLFRRSEFIGKLWHRERSRLNLELQGRIETLAFTLHRSVSIFQDKAGLSLTLLWLFISWALTGLMSYTIMQAVHLPVPWSAALVQLVFVNLGVMIPSSPGGVGVVHYLSILALSLWAIESSQSLAFALLFHGIPYLLTLGLGGCFLVRQGIRLRNLRYITS